MNKYIKLGLACGMFLMSSCVDVMDTKPTESYEEELVWGSIETANAFVYGTYNKIFDMYANTDMGKNNYSYVLVESFSPNGIHSNLSSLDGFPTETGIDRNTDWAKIFDTDKSFHIMRCCNMIIERAETSAVFTQQQKDELIATGRFLRGYLFLMQARWTGRFVPILKVLDENSTEAFKTPLTATPAESYKLIVDDFKAAAEGGLPEEAEAGLASKYTAYALLSRAALQAYAYTKEDNYLTICIDAAKKVIESGKHPLTSDYGGMFLEEGSKDAEILLAYYRLDQNTKIGPQFENELLGCIPNINNNELSLSQSTPALKDPNGRSFEGWGTFFPTQDLVDQYLVIDQQDNQAKPWYETSQYKENVDELPVSSLQIGDIQPMKETGAEVGSRWNVPEDADLGTDANGRQKVTRYAKVKEGNKSKIQEIMYNNRDKRFYGTIVYDSCVWLNKELVTTCCRGNLWGGNRDGQSDSWYTTASGYYWKKGVYDVTPRIYYNNKLNYHLVLARTGEMYMNLAEAYLLKKQFTPAREAINATRTKHGELPEIPASVSSEEQLWKEYMRERRVEMANENDIYFSYLRWGKYGGYANEGAAPNAVIKALNVPVHRIQISKDRKKFFIGQIVRNGANARKFTVRRYLLPIPQSGLDQRAASGMHDKQNPEW